MAFCSKKKKKIRTRKFTSPAILSLLCDAALGYMKYMLKRNILQAFVRYCSFLLSWGGMKKKGKKTQTNKQKPPASIVTSSHKKTLHAYACYLFETLQALPHGLLLSVQ